MEKTYTAYMLKRKTVAIPTLEGLDSDIIAKIILSSSPGIEIICANIYAMIHVCKALHTTISPLIQYLCSQSSNGVIFEDEYDCSPALWLMLVLAIKNDRTLEYHSPERLKSFKPFVWYSVRINAHLFTFIPITKPLFNDRDITLAAIKGQPVMFKYSSPHFKKDKSFVLDAIARNAMVFQFISSSFQCDKEIILAPITKTPCIYGDVPAERPND